LETPSTVPRPMALISITVKTMQILNDRLHKVDDKNKTPDKRCTNKYKWFRDA